MKILTTNLLATLLVTGLLGLTSCSSTSEKTADSTSAESLVNDNANLESLQLNGSSDENTAGPLKTVYFGFNSSNLSSAAKSTLEENATYLKLTDAVSIQVEGHCDERGGIQYNIALGERRAQAVKDYLVALGVNADRISTVSYGKDRPVAFGHDEDAWSQNRRANFVVTAK